MNAYFTMFIGLVIMDWYRVLRTGLFFADMRSPRRFSATLDGR
jgi:hypothetical protein